MANANIAYTIEPYRKGTPLGDWVERLGFFFIVNKVQPEAKRAHFITLSGPTVFAELKLLYPNGNLSEISYDDMIAKLRARFDKTESDLIQRLKFNNRVQQPDESAEDFVLSVKLQAEYCSFDNFKSFAIRDRIVAGVRDRALQQKLLNEEKLTLEMAEKIITTWEMAGANAKSINVGNNFEQIAAVRNQGHMPFGSRMAQLARTYDLAHEINQNRYNRAPVKSRLGYKSYPRNTTFQGNQHWRNTVKSRSTDRYQQRPNRPNYAEMICNFCGIKGHIRRRCFKLKNMTKDTVNMVHASNPEAEEDTSISELLNRMSTHSDSDSDDGSDAGSVACMLVSSINKISDPCLVELTIEGKHLKMEVDCGSSVSVISKAQYYLNFSNPLKEYGKQLIVVNGEKLRIEGEANVFVRLNGIEAHLQLLVLDCTNNFIPLMGRTWLDLFYSDWRRFFSNSVSVNNLMLDNKDNRSLEIQEKFGNVFVKDFSTPIRGFEADLVLKTDQPIFKKAYDVPYRLRQRVIDYLTKLEKEKVITPIKTSEWASPVVVVMKKNNEIRLVIDCKVSINKVIIPNTYPLPTAQDVFARLAGCKVFCALDLEGAYTQLALSNRSKKFMVINTIKGLFTYNRLPQGASSSAAIFQQVMDTVLGDIENVETYLDDVLIAGKDFDDCKRKLYLVLQRLSTANIKVNWGKCKFFVNQLPFLGHVISEKGLLPNPDKVSTIVNAKPPGNVTELKSYLGLLNYYNRFLPNLSSKLCNLYALLRNNVKFVWDHKCDTAFKDSKNLLLQANFLEFYDPQKPIVVVTDASGYGLGGVIAHTINNVEKPICFTSFTLNDAQKTYPILHLEALALVSTIKKFHKYLYGQKFTVFTDHKPLVGIFGKDGKHSIYVTKLQRYILELSIYDFDIQYRPSAKMGNADFCSRFPLRQMVPNECDYEFIKSINFSKDLPIDFKAVALATKDDNFLQNIITFLRKGWPKKIDKSYNDVYSNQRDLEIVEECLLYQDRVVIPKVLQKDVLKLLHANHSGIVKMKQLARRTVYWFGLNTDIEKFALACDACNSMAIVPKPKVTSKWIPTNRPFSRVHVDFFFFKHHTFLLIVDSFSKWLEIEWMTKGTDCNKVLKKLVEYFARYGLPDVLVSDGGPPFNSLSFVKFLERQGVKVLKSPPYNPSSNGQAERCVRTVKEVLKKFLLDDEIAELELEDQINLFLFNYRNSALTKDGEFPSEKIFNFMPKTLVDLINPKKYYKNQLIPIQPSEEVTNEACPNNTIDLLDNLMAGDMVWYRNHNPHHHSRWLKATFLKRFSKNTFQVETGNVRAMAHRTQLRPVKDNVLLQPNVTVRAPPNPRESVSEDDDGPFLGFPEEASKNTRKRKHQGEGTEAGLALRRSKRRRTVVKDNNFVYN